jgi:hypothetical protein
MRTGLADFVRRKGVGARLFLRRWRRNEDGFTAVEFGIVGLPFVMLLFGLLSICLYFFTNFTVENAIWQTSRAIRTGQFQQSQGDYTGLVTLDDRKKEFKRIFCEKAPTFLECDKAIVLVQSSASFSGISEPKCAVDGTMVDQDVADEAFDAGADSSVVFITVCYPWSFGGRMPFIKLGNLKDGATLIQASVAFRTEPYK